MSETSPGIPSSMERLGLGRTSRPHTKETKQPTMTGEANSRAKWSEDVVKNAIGGVFGKDTSDPVQFREGLDSIKSDGLRKYVKASMWVEDSELGVPGEGRKILLERQAGLRRIVEEEGLDGQDEQVALAMSQEIGKRLHSMNVEASDSGRADRGLSSRIFRGAERLAEATGRGIGSTRGGAEVRPGRQEELLERLVQNTLRPEEAYVPIENPETAEGQVRGILKAIDDLEGQATLAQKEIPDSEVFGQTLLQIRRAIDRIPDSMSQRPEYKIAGLYTPDGKEVYLKEKLQLLLSARTRLHAQAMKVQESGGNLEQLGVGADKTPLKGIIAQTGDITPLDWHILVHHDELFKAELGGREDKEVNVRVADALKLWIEVGENWETSVAGLPAYDENALNSDQKMMELRAQIGVKFGRKAEQIAFAICRASLSFDRFDRFRKKDLGHNDPRDLMHFEAKRLADFLKGKGPGPDDTVGAYFTPEESLEEAITEAKKLPGDIARSREKTLKDNVDMTAFTYDDAKQATGELIGDLWQSTKIKVGRDKKSILEIAQGPGGWKSVPFRQLDNAFYEGYFGSLGRAKGVASEINNRGYKLEEVMSPAFWQDKAGTFSFLKDSPVLQSLPDKERERALEKIKRNYAIGVYWLFSDKPLAKRGGILGRLSFGTALSFQPKGIMSLEQTREVARAIKTSGFLQDREMDELKRLINSRGRGYRFSDEAPARR